MKFNAKQRIGLIFLIIMIGVLQFVIIKVDFSQFIPLEKVNDEKLSFYLSKIDSLENLREGSRRRYFKFNPNKLTYKSWSYFGLSSQQLYSLDSFRAIDLFSSSAQVKKVLCISDSLFNIIDTLMYFPKDYKVYSQRDNLKKRKKKIVYKKFNPNKLLEEEWIKLGFSQKQSKIICDFRDRIGGFKVKSDIKKIFIISAEKYKQMSDYIDLPSEIEVRTPTLNTATLDDFKIIDGIGDVYAKMIIDYRNKLGGFYSYYQLNEIKGLDSVTISFIRGTFVLEKDYNFKVLDVNRASFEQLKSHPYVSYKLAREIVDFRTNFRVFRDLKEIRNIEEMSDAYFNKIKLYLVVDKK